MSSSFQQDPIDVDEWKLRELFNSAGILDRVQRGEIVEVVTRSSHPASPVAGEPFCTRSQTVEYYDAEWVFVAMAHRYLRKDRAIGLSGRPDPKKVVVEGQLYRRGRHSR